MVDDPCLIPSIFRFVMTRVHLAFLHSAHAQRVYLLYVISFSKRRRWPRRLRAINKGREIVKADAVTKRGDNTGVGASNGSVGNPKVRTKHYNQPLDDEGLVLKATEQLVAHQPWKVVTEAGGETLGQARGGRR